ncbi:hypothetical protein Hanom_Chr05g00397401 [Helianthus anomalus]
MISFRRISVIIKTKTLNQCVNNHHPQNKTNKPTSFSLPQFVIESLATNPKSAKRN